MAAAYSYDADGNLVAAGARSYSWDALNRLQQVEEDGLVLASYSYDSQNRRIRESSGIRTGLVGEYTRLTKCPQTTGRIITLKSRGYAAILSFCFGVMPPMPILGRSLL